MTLQLDDKPARPIHQEFYGRPTDQMPKLIADNREPASVACIMDRRLNATGTAKDAWKNNYFFTGDAVARHPDGRAKIILDAQLLRKITPDTKLVNWALPLEGDLYDKLEGVEFTVEQVKEWHGKWMKEEAVNEHPAWLCLARSPELLREYSRFVFEETGKTEAMALYFPSVQDEPIMRLWYVIRLDYRSDAYGGTYLDGYSGRLVGVAPEALGEK